MKRWVEFKEEVKDLEEENKDSKATTKDFKKSEGKIKRPKGRNQRSGKEQKRRCPGEEQIEDFRAGKEKKKDMEENIKELKLLVHLTS